jgi:hypothetical protein
MHKTRISQSLLVVTALLVVAAFAAAHKRPQHAGPATRAPSEVDLAIALDTSGSMDGLIDSARQKLWDVVNVMAKAQPQPKLRVGLLSYGNNDHDPAVGWVAIDSDLSGDLDTIYAKLFALRTNGGEEYVARAVQTATERLSWRANALKILFVAGNEPATQDPVVPLERALGLARERGILVNAIYCGSERAGEAVGWRQVASLGKGEFASIDQDHAVAIATPMDATLGALSAQLNGTYLAFGPLGGAAAANQALQDQNALSRGGAVAASRAVAKSSPMYKAEGWDLVDAVKDGKKSVAKMPVAELPEPMKPMAPADRERYVEEKTKERSQLQARIAEVAKQRDQFIAAEKAKHKPGAPAALDDALTHTLREEATKAGFRF